MNDYKVSGYNYRGKYAKQIGPLVRIFAAKKKLLKNIIHRDIFVRSQ